MEPRIDLSVSCADWWTDLPDLTGMAEETARAVLRRRPEAWMARAEIHIAFVDDARQQTLNRDFRGRDATTNVLAFASLDDLKIGCGANPIYPEASKSGRLIYFPL